MRRYGSLYEHGAEGGIAKVLGVLFVLIGIYALLDLYDIFSIEAITSNYVLIGCAIGAILGGLYMLGRSSRNRYGY